MTDREILIQLVEKVDLIYELLSNHLYHHFIFNMALVAAILGLISSLVILLVKKKRARL